MILTRTRIQIFVDFILEIKILIKRSPTFVKLIYKTLKKNLKPLSFGVLYFRQKKLLLNI